VSLDSFVLKETWNDGYNTRLGELIPLLRNYREMLRHKLNNLRNSAMGFGRDETIAKMLEEIEKLDEVLE